MKIIKVLIFTVLICAGLIFNGELYILYMYTFETHYYSTDFYMNATGTAISNDEAIADFINAGKNNNVDFFLMKREDLSHDEINIYIYGTNGVEQSFKERGIKLGKAESLFFGNRTVIYDTIENIEDISDYKSIFFIGTEEKLDDIKAFKAETIDKYAGGFPNEYLSDYNTYMNILTVWGIIYAIILLITLYSIMFQRKENIIHVILGEDLRKIFLNNIIADFTLFHFIFLGLSYILSYFSYVKFKFPFICLMFEGFIIFNLIFNFALLKVNFKRDLQTVEGKGLLTLSYAFKIVASMLVVMLIAGNVIIFREMINLYMQKDFFKTHSNYSFTAIAGDTSASVDDEFDTNRRFFSEFQDKAIIYADGMAMRPIYPIVIINDNAFDELRRGFSSIEDKATEIDRQGINVLIPDSLKVDSKEYLYALKIIDIYGKKGDNENIIEYKSGIAAVSTLYIDKFSMILQNDPILIYVSGKYSYDELSEYWFYNSRLSNNVMYDISQEEWDSYLSRNGLTNRYSIKTNVYKAYDSLLGNKWQACKLVIMLSGIILILEMLLTAFILKIEYKLNAIEIALKKVHGYSLASRNKKIIITSLISIFIGFAAALIFSRILNIRMGSAFFIAALLMTAFELTYELYKAKKIEKYTLSSILKGERL